MDLKDAIQRLGDAASQNTGGSAGAATVLLFGWNANHPIRGLMSLDGGNSRAALTVIDAALRRRLKGGQIVEDVLGYSTINDLVQLYGAHGTAWED